MTPPIRPVRAPIPGTPIRKLKRFVTDTLFPVAGGPVQMNRSRGFSPLGPMNEALTMAPLRPAQGDTAIVFYKEPTDEVASHEIGHLIDHRNLAPLVLANVEARRRPHLGPVRTQDDYFRSNREEYVAEAFARAIESGRRQRFTDSTKVDREFPGSIELIRWLQTRPPFAKPQRPSTETPLGRIRQTRDTTLARFLQPEGRPAP